MAAAAPASSPATGSSAGAYAWYVAFLLASAHLVSFVDRFLMSLVLEPLKADLGLSDTQLGLLTGTGFVILYTVAAVPLGLMADRINRRNLIVAGILLWSIATALCGLADSFGSLFLARVGVGFGEAALVPAAMSLLAAYFPRRQLGRAVSLFTTGASLGKSAALMGGGAILALLTAAGGLKLAGLELQPWQGTFVLMAIPGIVLALLIFTVREPARAPSILKKSSISEAAAYVRKNRRAYASHTGAAALVVLVIQSLAAWAPSFYVRYFDMTPSEAGLAVGSVILIAAPLGHLSGGYLTDHFQKRGSPSPAAPVIIGGLLLAIPCALLFGTTRDPSLSLLAYGLLNFCITLGAPASLAGVQMLTPDRLRGVVTSMFLAVTTFVGIGIGPPMIGLLTDNVFGGPLGLNRSLMLAICFFGLLGALLALASRRPFERTASIAADTGVKS